VWGADIWETTLRVRAYENGTFVVGIGKAGVEDDLPYVGHSVIVSPLSGTVLATAQTDGNELVMATIDLNDTIEARTRMPYPRDRRPEHYSLLSDARGAVPR
jgi:N-carbamoylputrescine amidase